MSTVPTRSVYGVVKGYPAAAAGLKARRRRRLDRRARGHRRDLAKSIIGDGRPAVPDARRPARPACVVDRPSAREERPGHLPHRHPDQVQDGPRLLALPAARKSAHLTWALTSGTFTGIGHLFFGQGTHQISSSVGIVRDTADAYRQSLQDYFFFLGYISLALALLNLLPILPLDGGHIVMSLLERIRGRAFSQLAYLRYSAIGSRSSRSCSTSGLRNDLFSGGS